MWPIVLAFGTVALFISLAGRAKAAKPGVLVTPSVPSALPPAVTVPITAPITAPVTVPITAPITAPEPVPTARVPGLPVGCTEADRTFVANVIRSMAKGTASLDLTRKAHALALRCFPATAVAIKQQLDKAVAVARAKAIPDATKQLGAIITGPDAPPTPIPREPKSGKGLWSLVTRGGVFMAIPNFRPVLNLFKKLQAAVGAKQDGRIGPETVTKFRNVMTSRGFKKFPTNQGGLAANVVKYITVITQKVPPAQVGHHLGQSTFYEIGGSAQHGAPFPGS